jgi:hypothetical protein
MRGRYLSSLAGFIAACVFALFAQPTLAATKHALFVAVNEYPNLEPKAALSGPANDTEIMLGYLTGTPDLGFERANITVLANGGIDNDGAPTRAAVLDRMEALAGKVVPGDFVYIHFAGHGSRQRARNPATEPDGLDEVFLPEDTEEAHDGVYPNALVDDDIGARLDAIRAAGAFVFIVFDSCHSSTATRTAGAPSADIRYRWLPEPEASAKPSAVAMAEMREPALGTGEAGAATGGMVAFFAAQTIEPTPELPMPRGSDGTKKYGLFSYTLLDVLAKNPGITYRELAQGIMHAYAVGNFSKPTPLFEGDLDRVVFAQAERRSTLSWPVAIGDGRVSLPAGGLHGLEKGAILALLPGPLAGEDEVLGHVLVRTSDPLTAQATPARHGGLPAPVFADLPAGVHARVVETPLSFELRVALPSTEDTRFADAAAYARREIETIAANEQLPVNLRPVEAGENADLKLIVASEAELYPGAGEADEPRLWFLPPGGALPTDPRFKPHSIGLAGGMTPEQREQLEENFAAVFRAASLAQLSQLSLLDRERVRFGLELKRASSGTRQVIDGSAVPLMEPGDELIFGIDNQSTSAVDVDMLLIGPNYAIKHMLGLRFQRGDKVEGALGDIADAGMGLWRLILVMREAPRNSDHRDLSFLNQIGTQTRASAATGARDFGQLLKDIGNAPPTRGASRAGSRNALKGSLEIFSLEAVPGD